MPIYVQVTTFTDEGRKVLKDKIKGESKAVNQRLEELGVKVLAQYNLLGHYDMINILEAPDNSVMFREAMEVCHANIATTLTMPALAIEDFKKVLQ